MYGLTPTAAFALSATTGRRIWVNSDLLRTGQAISVMTAYGILQKEALGFLLPNSYSVTQNKLIYAIPFRETQVNPALGQNAGY